MKRYRTAERERQYWIASVDKTCDRAPEYRQFNAEPEWPSNLKSRLRGDKGTPQHGRSER
jgi:hypothetical protein